MPTRNSKENVFKELVNKQLEPYNKTYDDVKTEDKWFEHYTTTKEKQEEFIKWGAELIRKKFRFPKKRAEKEMGWFILGYGLKTEK